MKTTLCLFLITSTGMAGDLDLSKWEIPLEQRVEKLEARVAALEKKCEAGRCRCHEQAPSEKKQSGTLPATREVLFFTADWCPHCPRVKASLASAIANGKVRVVDCTHDRGAANRFGVRGFPSVLLVVDGEVLRFTHDAFTEADVDRWLNPPAESSSKRDR